MVIIASIIDLSSAYSTPMTKLDCYGNNMQYVECNVGSNIL
jgi:hypothetical protein